MCTNPRVFRPSHVYNHSILNTSAVTCGCGRCDECREVKRNEWVNRLSFEFNDFNIKGGKAIFLTFTYDNDHLPVFTDPDTGFSTLCFNHNDVKTFLGSLEDYYMHIYGYKPYKYFFASEYGKTTQRPHYHCLFFIDVVLASNWYHFVEVCREIWNKPIRKDRPQTLKTQHKFGFMFPRLCCPVYNSDGVIVSGRYVDEKRRDRTPLITSGVKGMTYVSKYATKDMSFYSDEINEYLASSNGFKLKDKLPKHWQSKKLGYSAVTSALSNLDTALSLGIINPLTLKYIPVPQYAINKILYKNVYRGRVSPLGKKLYDRELSSFGISYLSKVFKSRCIRTAHKMSELFQLLGNTSTVDFPVYTRWLLSLCGINNMRSYQAFLPCAIYHHFYKNFNQNLYETVLRSLSGSFSDLLTFHPVVLAYYVKTKDTSFKRLHPVSSNVFKSRYDNVFGFIPFLDAVYCDVSRNIQSNIIKDRVKNRLQSYATKELLSHGFPLNLC